MTIPHSVKVGTGGGLTVPVNVQLAGIQVFLLDSRQKHAGMTFWDNGRSILWTCPKQV